ncbi:EF-hand calcium-binding domain-containing protein 4B-like isoform X2 [Mya arenaria]|uniref:EF-hand calcium-binding domain-containing protein 4B-like isoform X2 n=1 Tax=Mya arenaria TaxID=6604 RepID=UPI0022E37958|nr:EF-hand calcium-binding domain-containing protein 4B-like isoform X2 [Mya arenaria]
MSNYDDDEDVLPSSAEIQQMMSEKAKELFTVCDAEEKGFITKRDMQRLQSQLPLSPDQLEHVFDSLDGDGNGFLTLEEFTDGFGGFLGMRSSDDCCGEMSSGATYSETVDPAEEEQNFHDVMEQLGAASLIEGDSTIKHLWCRLRKDDSDIASTFEDFLFRISSELKKSKCEFNSLEEALRSKTSAHDEEVRKLYEEMETQIRNEKQKILNEERAKERSLREAMEQELTEKDRHLQELLTQHTEMEEKLGFLNTVEAETKIEKEKLAKEKEELEESFHRSQNSLTECQAYINQLRQQQKDDKRERAKDALKLTEGIALERETLVSQLEKLKTLNRRLQDEKDEAVLRRQAEESMSQGDNSVSRRGELERQGSSLGKYFNTKRVPTTGGAESIQENLTGEMNGSQFYEVECDDDVYTEDQTPSFIHHNSQHAYHHGNHPLHSSPIIRQHGDNRTIADLEEDGQVAELGQTAEFGQTAGRLQRGKQDDTHDSDLDTQQSIPKRTQSPKPTQSPKLKHLSPEERIRAVSPHFDQIAYTTTAVTNFARIKDSEGSLYSPDSPRTQPVGADEVGADEMSDSGIQSTMEPAALQRIFKVVFVGDSGVGKSSFIHRFCTGNFRPSFAATIGVDFQIRSMNIDCQVIVLQLWDTAGQERFRSITKQYFRKADGVVIMYDSTSETTFTNVRNWMDSVKEGASEDAVLLLLGNKSDLSEDDDKKAIKMKDGSHLADEFGTLFYETSALNGENVKESMEAMARLLKDKEDKQIEKSFKLDDTPAKTKCCSF